MPQAKPQPTIFDVFDRTNWATLRKQKLALIEATDDARGQRADLLEGLLAFLDCVQDAAQDAHGYPVFTKSRRAA